ncbi:MAG: hypothetical protein HZA54_16090 [Planctomycetes bacterium]|nr:hypothetical protein [Planctomycetota bacterium]
MAIQTTCAGCSSSFGVPDFLAGMMTTCPRCQREVLVPGTMDSLMNAADDAVEVLPSAGAGPRYERRQRSAMCPSCGWKTYDEDWRCESCGAWNRAFLRVFTIFAAVFGTVFVLLGLSIWRYYVIQGYRVDLQVKAQELWARRKQWYEGDKGFKRLKRIQEEHGWSDGPVRGWALTIPEVEVPWISISEGGIAHFNANLTEHVGKLVPAIRYSIFIRQRYRWNSEINQWEEDGPFQEDLP